MLEVIGKYATQNGIALVLDVSNQQTVLWADLSVNITDEIIKLYDQAHPGTAAAPKPPAGVGTGTAKPAATPPPAASPKPTPPPAPQTKKQ